MGPHRMMSAVILLFASLTVALAQEPSLKVMPGTISKSLGEPVYASCSAKVEDPDLVTEMTWTTPGGQQIPGPDTDHIETIGEGAGSLGLYIQKLTDKDTGVYNCSAVYAGNKNLHVSIHIKSFVSIDFGDTPTHQTPIVGTDALIKCTVMASPAPHVDWLKDGIAFRTDERHIIQQDGVLVKSIEESDEGVYRCRARVAELGTLDSRDIQVQVLVPPKITTPPEHSSGVEKQAVTFQCVAAGKPAPKYSWVDEQSRPLTGLEGFYVDEVKGELTILDLRPDQDGTYRCTATNAAGSDVAEARLKVLTKPKLESFLNITVDVTGTAEFRCLFSGDPMPEIIFQKETDPETFVTGINVDTRIEVTESVDEYGNRVGIMKISEVDRSDDGLYTCSGHSTGGDTVGWGHITVQFPPTFAEQPTNEFWSWEQEKVNLTCLATSIPNATVQWYLRNKEIPKEDLNLRVMSLGPVGVLEVNPLDTSYFGTYTCQASNMLGVAENDVSLSLVHTPGPLTSVQIGSKSATTVTWKLMEPVDNGGRPITMYLVQYALQGTGWEDGQTTTWTKGSSYTLEGLRPQTSYNFRFAARNEVGISEWSGMKTEEMNEVGAPETPTIFVRGEGVVNDVPYTDRYDLQWKTPLDNGSPIDKFMIMYYQVVNMEDKWETIGIKSERDVEFPGPTTYTLQGLRPDTFYRIELRAHNEIGYSRPSDVVIQTANGTAAVVSAPHTPASLALGVIIAIVVIAILVTAIVTDVICFFCKDAGVTATLIHKVANKEGRESEAMLETGKGSSEKLDSKNGPPPPSDNITEEKDAEPLETTPMIQGDGGDKAAILKEEAAAAAANGEQNPARKDSPV